MNVSEQAIFLLTEWIDRQSAKDAQEWFHQSLDSLKNRFQEQDFFIAFGVAPRKMGKEPLQLSPEDLKKAHECREGWNPQFWTLDQAIRLTFLLSLPAARSEDFTSRLDQLCQTAEGGELICLYRGLPLYPWPESHIVRTAEGIRSNIKAVFEAVAHFNSYPKDYLSEGAWNQMVLKALFIGSPLLWIQGLDQRANSTLAQMLVDYAHERWAAKRPVSFELWRCVGPYMNETMIPDFQRLLTQGSEEEKKAAVLALHGSSLPSARALLGSVKELHQAAEEKQFAWDTLKSS
ncbi:MAG: EboA domain-containing protein [Planctomycetota bacterium]